MGMSADVRAAARQDRRVVRSRRAIVRAFEQLLAERPLDKITVSAIAQRADVDRKTFYQHFGSISGLLDAIAWDFAARVLDEVECTCATSGRVDAANGRTGAAPEMLHAFFRALAGNLSANMARERGFFEHVPAEVLYERLRAPFERQIVERGLIAGIIADDIRKPALAFVLGGMLALMRDWLEDGDARAIDDVVSLACALTERGLAGIALSDDDEAVGSTVIPERSGVS